MQNPVNDLATDQVESPSVDQASVDTPFVPEAEVDWDDPSQANAALEQDGILDAYFNDRNGTIPSAPVVSEETVEVKEESTESDDTSTPETSEETTEDTPTEEEDDSEENENSPDSDKFEVELHGKKMKWSWTEIQNQLKRSESASNESREAKSLKEELEAERANIAEERKFIQANVKQNQMHPALTDQLAKVQKAKAEMDEKFQDQALDFPYAKHAYEEEVKKYNGMNQEYQNYVNQQIHYKTQEQRNQLTKLGIGHLLTDQTAGKEFTDYLNKNYSPEDVAFIRSNAATVKSAYDSMLWNNSQVKGKSKSVKKGPARKSLKGGGKSIAQHSAANKPKNTTAYAVGGNIDPESDAVLDAYFANRRF